MPLGVYRTCTYIAGDWDNDKSAVDQLHHWNDSNHWGLTFKDVHDLTSSRDSSKPCSIKASLKARMDVSKTFVLIVGDNTANLRKGLCEYCSGKVSDVWERAYRCPVGKTYYTTSFVDYECKLAAEACKQGKVEIIVLYKAHSVNKSKCPAAIRELSTYLYDVTHVAMKTHAYQWGNYVSIWDYNSVRAAFDK